MQHQAASTKHLVPSTKQQAQQSAQHPIACAGFVCLMILVCGRIAFAAEQAKANAQTKVRANAEDVKAALTKPVVKAKSTSESVKPSAEDEAKTLRKIVEGKITSLTKRSISVEYETKGSESNEMLLMLGANLAVEGVKSLSELKAGDHVKVGVEQTYKDVPNGERVILKTEALVIALVKPTEGG